MHQKWLTKLLGSTTTITTPSLSTTTISALSKAPSFTSLSARTPYFQSTNFHSTVEFRKEIQSNRILHLPASFTKHIQHTTWPRAKRGYSTNSIGLLERLEAVDKSFDEGIQAINTLLESKLDHNKAFLNAYKELLENEKNILIETENTPLKKNPDNKVLLDKASKTLHLLGQKMLELEEKVEDSPHRSFPSDQAMTARILKGIAERCLLEPYYHRTERTPQEERILYDQQQLMREDPKRLELFYQTLRNIAKLAEDNHFGFKPTCFISHAWAKDDHSFEKWVEDPFLIDMYTHLREAGIEAKLDAVSLPWSKRFKDFMNTLPTSNHVLLIGTESFFLKEKDHLTGVSYESELMQKRKKMVDEQKRIFPVTPIILSGNYNNAFPIEYYGIKAADFRTNSYVKSIKELLRHLYQVNEKDILFDKTWEEFEKKYPNAMKLFPDIFLPYATTSASFTTSNKLTTGEYIGLAGIFIAVATFIIQQEIQEIVKEEEEKQKRRHTSIEPDLIEPVRDETKFTKRQATTAIEEKINMKRRAGEDMVYFAITGGQGSGKTEIANEYYYHYKRRQNSSKRICTAWIFYADNLAALEEDYKYFASNKLKIDIRNCTQLEEIIQLVNEELEHREDWLLIFDNVKKSYLIQEGSIVTQKNGYDAIKHFLPQGDKQKGCVLLTSESSKIWQNKNVHNVSLNKAPYRLTQDETIDLFEKSIKKHFSDLEKHSLLTLAAELGYIPLALRRAAAFIENQTTDGHYQEAIAAYKAKFQKLTGIDEKRILTSKDHFEINKAVNKLAINAMSQEAQNILSFLIFLPAQQIDPNAKFVSEFIKKALPSLTDRDYNASFEALEQFYLLESGKLYKLHASVKEAVIELEAEKLAQKEHKLFTHLNKSDQEVYKKRFMVSNLQTILSYIRLHANNYLFLPSNEKRVPYVESLMAAVSEIKDDLNAQKEKRPIIHIAQVLDSLANYYSSSNDAANAMNALREAKSWLENQIKDNNKRTSLQKGELSIEEIYHLLSSIHPDFPPMYARVLYSIGRIGYLYTKDKTMFDISKNAIIQSIKLYELMPNNNLESVITERSGLGSLLIESVKEDPLERKKDIKDAIALYEKLQKDEKHYITKDQDNQNKVVIPANDKIHQAVCLSQLARAYEKLVTLEEDSLLKQAYYREGLSYAIKALNYTKTAPLERKKPEYLNILGKLLLDMPTLQLDETFLSPLTSVASELSLPSNTTSIGSLELAAKIFRLSQESCSPRPEGRAQLAQATLGLAKVLYEQGMDKEAQTLAQECQNIQLKLKRPDTHPELQETKDLQNKLKERLFLREGICKLGISPLSNRVATGLSL